MTDAHQLIDADGLIAFAQRLVRIPSVNRPEDGLSEARAAAAVADQMRAFGWQPTVDEVAPGRPNVIARIAGGPSGPTLMFEGHTDVVTEGNRDDWSFDPFSGDIVDGRLLGRGAADMKGGVAAILYAVRALQQAGSFPGTIVLGILCDEEEMMIGAHDFIARGHAQGVDAAIVAEPEGGEVCVVQKGAVRLRVDVCGEMAHGAMPDKGRNPLPAISRFLAAVDEIEKDLQSRHGEHPHLGWTYLTPTHVAAGSIGQINVIPAHGTLTLDIRTLPGVDHDLLRRRLRGAAEDITASSGVEFAFTTLVDRPPTETPEDHPIVQALASAHEVVTGAPARYGGVPGTTDGTILSRDAGIPVVVYGPGDKWIAHQKDEYVEVADLIQAAHVYLEAAYRFLTKV